MRANIPALIPLALAGLLLAVAPVNAQDGKTEPACPDGQLETPEGCSQQAWIDCPPDQYCIASEEPTYGDCGAEVCAYDGGNGTADCGPEECIPYGPDGCIECSGPAPDTCMDGAQGNETCRDDVQYIGGPDTPVSDADGAGRGPADCENCRGDDLGAEPESAIRKDASGLGLAATLALVGTAMVAFVARRQM